MKTNLILSVYFTCCVLSACNTNPNANIDTLQNELSINVYTLEINSRSEIVDKLSVIALNSETNETAYGTGIKGVYKYDATAETPITLLSENAIIYACSPISDIKLNDKTPYITIPNNIIQSEQTIRTIGQNYPLAHDYRYGVNYIPPTDSKKEGTFTLTQSIASSTSNIVNIGMKHAFATIHFSIIASSDSDILATNSNKITKVELIKTINTTATATTMNLTDGAIKNNTENSNGYTFTLSDFILSKEIPITWSALALPVTKKTDTKYKIKLTLDDKIITSADLDDVEWEAGFKYTYNIIVSPTAISLQTIQIEEWKDGTKQEVEIK